MSADNLTWPEVCAVLARWLSTNQPGAILVEVPLKLADGRTLPMSFVMPPLAAPAPPQASADEYQPFIPTAFQKAILKALEGKALRARALGAAVGESASWLYRPGGMTELRERGLVEQHERLGYYRPDAPPPELADVVEEDSGE
jgi:hypothetical protein